MFVCFFKVYISLITIKSVFCESNSSITLRPSYNSTTDRTTFYPNYNTTHIYGSFFKTRFRTTNSNQGIKNYTLRSFYKNNYAADDESSESETLTPLSSYFVEQFRNPGDLSSIATSGSFSNYSGDYTTDELSSDHNLSSRGIQYGSKMDFLGKVVLVTGATSGIGKAIALHFAKLGATLSLTGKDLNKLYDTYEKDIKPWAIVKPEIQQGDLSNNLHARHIMRRTITRFKKLDILVNCAGIYEIGSIYNTSVEKLDLVFASNVRSLYSLSKAAIVHLEKTKGTIINISSIAGLRPYPGILAYSMSKAAVDQFTKCLALELGPKGIRVNSVNPSLVGTGLHVKAGMNVNKYRKYIRNSRKNHPLGRITTVKDICRAVAFLASKQASFITGVNFPVDGGRSIHCQKVKTH